MIDFFPVPLTFFDTPKLFDFNYFFTILKAESRRTTRTIFRIRIYDLGAFLTGYSQAKRCFWFGGLSHMVCVMARLAETAREPGGVAEERWGAGGEPEAESAGKPLLSTFDIAFSRRCVPASLLSK